jgi:hypothetical protein
MGGHATASAQPRNTRAMGSCLLDRVRAATVGIAREFWPRAVAEAVGAGVLEFEAFTALQQLQEPTPCGAPPQGRLRLPPRTRRDRWEERPETPSGRFVRAISLDPVLDWGLSDGAVRCLQLVTSLAGGVGRSFVTLTCSIARQLGRTRRTVQYYWSQLVEAGYIERTFDRKTGFVTITVTDAVKPAPLSRDENSAPWPQPPKPKVWRRVVRGGAQIIAHIKRFPVSSSFSVHGNSDLELDLRNTEERLLGKGNDTPFLTP